ncbi:hypothetical protein N8878_03130 [Psychromonas sp.]|nr:hypothetical protein [Psychromonas sp.]
MKHRQSQHGLTQAQLDAALFESELSIQHTDLYFQYNEIELTFGVWDSSDMKENTDP